MGWVIEAIQDYLWRHPQAADNVKGISEWWLAGRASETEVMAALQQLERLQIVECLDLPGRAAVWRVREKV